MPSLTLLAATLGAGALAAGGAAYSGTLGAKAATSAADTQASAALAGQQLQADQFAQTQANLQPFVSTGQSALGALSNYTANETGVLEGLANRAGNIPSFQSMFTSPGAMNSFLESTPGYQFTKDQGLQAAQNSYAAQGLGQSGAALKGAAQYATGLASSTFQNQFQNWLAQTGVQLSGMGQAQNLLTAGGGALNSLASLGENAAAQVGSLGQQSVTSQNALTTAGAAAQAAGTVGSTNAITGGISGATSGIGNSVSTLALLNILKANAAVPPTAPLNINPQL